MVVEINPLNQNISSTNPQTRFLSQKKQLGVQIDSKPVVSNLKSAKGTLSVLAEEGKQFKQFSFGKLVKTKEFGGQGSAEGTSSGKISGGTITEVLSETGFCFYYALLVTNQLDTFKKESFKTVTDKKTYVALIKKLGLTEQLSDSLNDTQLQKYIPIMYDFLGTGFDEILRAQVKKFKTDYSNYSIH